MHENITYVGMDTDKRWIDVAMLLPGSEKEVEWRVRNERQAVQKMVRKIRRAAPGEVVACYEAGPCGYPLQRWLTEEGMWCGVVAPSMTPVKPGERVKTNRRDARKLVRNLRAGQLTFVRPPTPEEEAARDLCRAREDAQEDLMRVRHRLSKLLLRRAIVHPGMKAWTRRYMDWLRGLRFDNPVDQTVFDDCLLAVEQLEARGKALEGELAALAQSEPYREKVGWLRCFRGIETVTAMTIVAELHGPERFTTARQLMAFLGLVPSEHSTGERSRRGSITKTGNTHLRRALIQAAWAYHYRPNVGKGLAARRAGQPRWVIALADRAQVRLHAKYLRLVLGFRKHPNVAVTAAARELVGFVWAVLQGGHRQEREAA